VVDAVTRQPLPFANVAVLTTDPMLGATADGQGNFRIAQVPVGRHNLRVSFVGYEARVIPELLVGTGKEVILEVSLNESAMPIEEVVITAYQSKDKPLNTMATLSARTFSVEEARRYAGGFDDPARLASAFAGVSTGYLDDNGIIVRGNAPKGLLWRLEGVEIPNPNHYAGLSTFGGGGVSALSSLVLANSDFYTGAFPAEYGNAMSGVFDIRLRSGNDEHYEHAVQLGALGVDLASEGPISRKQGSSYLLNYRYSTFGLIKFVLPEDANVPEYQDLSFKVNLPAGRAGVFSLWGLGGLDRLKIEPDEDTSKWNYDWDRDIGKVDQKLGALGLNHRLSLDRNTFLNSSLYASGDQTLFDGGYLNLDKVRSENEYADSRNTRYGFQGIVDHKFNARHKNRTGVVASLITYDTYLRKAPEEGEPLVTVADEKGQATYLQAFSQSQLNLGTSLKLNLGIHTAYLGLNQEFVVEPRLGLTYALSNTRSLGLAYSQHSRMEPLGLYFAQVDGQRPNTELALAKAHHFVLSYDVSLSEYLRLKVEPYLQLITDVPVIADSTYSTLNMEAEWFFNQALVNDGSGYNYGLDITLERFLNKGYYFLLTASLFDSRYTGGDGVGRNTRYNTRYVVNALAGKEWQLGQGGRRVLGVNGRLNFLGGQRMTPFDEAASIAAQDMVYLSDQTFEDSKPDVYHLNLTLSYRINKPGHSSIWAIQVINALGTEEFYGYSYNFRTKAIDEDKNTVVVPSISYKIEF